MQQGLRQEAAHLLCRQLSRRFGPLDAAVQARIEEAPLERIERWAGRIFDVESLDQLLSEN